ncbi:MAG TPA: protein kinase, partial [Gemmataceae bacterium]
MPAPASVAELLDLVQKSGVADANRFSTYLDKLKQQGGLPAEPSKVAGLLVRDGMLTYFQAEQLLQGKYKRFSLGKYKVLEKLGSGGMGTVFLCEHKLMRRRVAVKVLPTAKAADEASLKRFYREAQAVAAVDHPNLVRAYDIDQDENLHFLVMEYVDGTNLQDLVKKFGPLDVVRACHYIYGAAVGLQHANEIGLVHRDIKPGNILLDRSGVIKILDLGLARFFHDVEDNLTRQYDESILGTADYLSPEQADDSHTVDIRSDIYSLGATFYFLLTGFPPFPEGTIPQKLIWVRGREPKAVRTIRPEVPEEVAAIVAKMMAKKPEDRYALPSDIMTALTPWAATPIAPPAEREMPQLSPAITGAGGGVRPGSAGAPRTMTSPVPLVNALGQVQPGSSTIVQSGHTPSLRSSSAETTEGVWGSLGDDDVPIGASPNLPNSSRTPQPKSGRNRQLPAAKKGRGFTLILAGVAVLVLGGAAAGIYFAFFNKKQPEPTAAVERGKKRIVVSKAQAGAENTVATLREAVQKVKEGDTIAIAESPLTEPLIRWPRLAKDVTIESALPGNKPVHIEFVSPGGAASFAMFDFTNCEGVRLKDLDLDGKSVAEYGISISGSAPGVTIENVTVRNVKAAPFRLSLVAGRTGLPFVLEGCRALVNSNNDAGILVTVPMNATAMSKFIAIRNCRIEGPGKAGIKFEGSVHDIEVIGNRFFNLDAAVAMNRVNEGRPFKLQFSQNTVIEAKIGLQFFGGGNGPMNVVVTRNYFGKTEAIGEAEGVNGVTVAENGERDSKPGK